MGGWEEEGDFRDGGFAQELTREELTWEEVSRQIGRQTAITILFSVILSCNPCNITRGFYLHCVSLLLSYFSLDPLSPQTTEPLFSLATDCQKSLLKGGGGGGGGGGSGSIGHVDSDLAERQFKFLTTLEPVVQLSAVPSSCLLSSYQLAAQLLTHSLTPPTSIFELEQHAVREERLKEKEVMEIARDAAKLAVEGNENVRAMADYSRYFVLFMTGNILLGVIDL